ncbi:MAG TPA: hypothetical protein VL354_22300 [Spirochaetia bacterium]|nr:hypothetical protein [Spirochaetia bacterium]
MSYYDYTDLEKFLHDEDLIHLLCADTQYPQLLERLLKDDFLVIDSGMKIPFFAEVRDYVGAAEKADPQHHWIVKPVTEDDALGAAMGSICFFLDFFTKTLSAPTLVTRIEGNLYKATKIITKAEQLTGANYTDIPQLKEQLLLDLVNRWIYGDEDRNPNNYMIRYTSQGNQVVIAIDFSNVDLLFPGTKIKGKAESFGWERIEKTRYLTPLKVEHFLTYDMELFDMRFDGFKKVGRKMLLELCKRCLRFQPDCSALAKTVTDNLLKRIEYVHDYFVSQFPRVSRPKAKEKYKDMGSTFTKIYKEK